MEVGFKYTATYNLVLARTFLSSIYAMCGQDTRTLIEFRGQFVNLGKLGVVQVAMCGKTSGFRWNLGQYIAMFI